METVRRTQVFMDTAVTVEVVPERSGDAGAEAAIDRSFAWFAEVEMRCSRFDPDSEVRRLAAQPGQAVPVSPVLFEAVRFALAVARSSGGAFDPTIGHLQERRGFDREYRTGRHLPSGLRPDAVPSWRDVRTDARRRTLALARPLLLDLGGVAKGLAMDLALRELAAFPGCAVEAGGDITVRGAGPQGGPWRVGIRHPRRPDGLCAVLTLTGGAACTSGDYERPAPSDGGSSHLLDPLSGRAADRVASCTVLAPTAMMADALSTAATVLGPQRAPAWLEREGVEGMLLTPELERCTTQGFARYVQWQ